MAEPVADERGSILSHKDILPVLWLCGVDDQLVPVEGDDGDGEGGGEGEEEGEDGGHGAEEGGQGQRPVGEGQLG